MRILVCGLNPSVVSADAGHGFARGSNRFWTAAVSAGLIDPPSVRRPLSALAAGVGMTDLVKRATPRARELHADEYRAGLARVGRLVRWLRPGLVLFVGLEGWRAAVDRRARPGLQPASFHGVVAYVMPSTSGINAHSRLADLVGHMRAALAAAPARL
jgi:TDG/mug DNA glycosylase family protein